MQVTLLNQFIVEECTPEVRDLLRNALEAGLSGTGPRRKHFEFNRFEITFDVDQGEVLIEDVLDVTEGGAQYVSLVDFSAALNKTS